MVKNVKFPLNQGQTNLFFAVHVLKKKYEKAGLLGLLPQTYKCGCKSSKLQNKIKEFIRGEKQKQLSKEFVRQWLIENGFQGKEGQQIPEMTEEVINNISDRYVELYENVTGNKFVAPGDADMLSRVEANIKKVL